MTIGDFIGILLCLILAAGLGILSQRILGFKIGGLFVSILIGFIGALVGRELYRAFHLPEVLKLAIVGGREFPVTWCFVGSLLATLIFGYFAKRGLRKEKRK